jgi:hypothetical protein
MLGKQRDRFAASQKEEAGMTWQPDEPMSQFRTRITLFFPGEPGKCQKFENVREYTLGTEHRIQGKLKDHERPHEPVGTGHHAVPARRTIGGSSTITNRRSPCPLPKLQLKQSERGQPPRSIDDQFQTTPAGSWHPTTEPGGCVWTSKLYWCSLSFRYWRFCSPFVRSQKQDGDTTSEGAEPHCPLVRLSWKVPRCPYPVRARFDPWE